MQNDETPSEVMEGNAIPPDLETTVICMALIRLGAAMTAVFEQSLSAAGIRQSSFRALMALSELQGTSGNSITPVRLADYLAQDSASADALIDRIVSQGLVERLSGTSHPTECLRLTPAGQAALSARMPLVVTTANQALDGVSSEEVARLLPLLARLEVNTRITIPMVSVL